MECDASNGNNMVAPCDNNNSSIFEVQSDRSHWDQWIKVSYTK